MEERFFGANTVNETALPRCRILIGDVNGELNSGGRKAVTASALPLSLFLSPLSRARHKREASREGAPLER